MGFFYNIAEPLALKGFRVFPVVANNKMPMGMSEGDHFDAATLDLEQLKIWDGNSNVGISPDEIWCFLETDSETELKEACKDLPQEIWDTASVSSGRVDRRYYIFRQTNRTRKVGNMTVPSRLTTDNLFEFKQHRALVVGPGSIHPKTKKPYIAEWRNIPAMPDVLLNRLCELKGTPSAATANNMSAETKRQTELLDSFLETYEVATQGDWFPVEGATRKWLRPIICPWDSEHDNPNRGSSTCIVYVEGGGYGFDCKHRCASKTWQEFRAELKSRFPGRGFSFVDRSEPVLLMGGTLPQTVTLTPVTAPPVPEAPKDWRTRYHSREEMENAPPIHFVIKDFLQADGVTGIAAPAGQRKSLIALNIAHSILTGDPLFDYFPLSMPALRCIYLCPEVSIGPFKDRLDKIGLMSYVGKTLFCRTMSAKEKIHLDDLAEELPDSVVILDTAVRFLEGDENSSEDMRAFADTISGLLQRGAVAVVILYHSPKGAARGDGMTLEGAMRGSGELGAFLSACWGTRLQDPDKPYDSPSFLSNLKQRDFISRNFEITSGKDCRLHIVGDPATRDVKLESAQGGGDGAKDAALAIVKANPDLSGVEVVKLLKEAGIERGKTWVNKQRYLMMQKAAAPTAKLGNTPDAP